MSVHICIVLSDHEKLNFSFDRSNVSLIADSCTFDTPNITYRTVHDICSVGSLIGSGCAEQLYAHRIHAHTYIRTST